MIDLRLRVTRRYPELERLVCAAISNTDFAAHLLVAPEAALNLLVDAPKLSPSERELVVNSTNGAADIHDFAARLYAEIQQPLPSLGVISLPEPGACARSELQSATVSTKVANVPGQILGD